MNQSDIADAGFRVKPEIFELKVFHAPGIQSDQDHARKQDLQCIAFMQAEKDFQKMFGVVNSHR